jgi:N-carbamoyl-L-amino-acid hydrolase
MRHGGLGTVGVITVKPNSRNTIAGEVFFTVDMRHPDEAALTRMNMELQRAIVEVCTPLGLRHECTEIWHSPAVQYNPSVVAAIRTAAERGKFAHMDIVSGAGHDAGPISRVAPTGMIFIPCAGGLSHNELESASKEDVAAGCNVLLQALLACDGAT